MNESFRKVAHTTSTMMGTPWAFIGAITIILVWAISGPLFKFSDTWQLVINTGTTIITFLMVFLIQNTQNRDAQALHLKLDELLRSAETARNSFVNLENMPDEELQQLQEEFQRLCEKDAGLVTDDLHMVEQALAKRKRKQPQP